MGGFRNTRWSLVIAAACSKAALNELYKLYWPPVYAYVRRTKRSPDDALDLTQSFFAFMLERKDLTNADPERGRFRDWLLGAVKNFLTNECRRAHAKKRGGGTRVLSIEEHTAEGSYPHEPVDELTPERAYARHWALSVIDHAMCRLEHEQATLLKGERFARLKPFLVEGKAPYDELARELGETAPALRQQVRRLRENHRKLLRIMIAQTVETPAEVDDEIRYFLDALS